MAEGCSLAREQRLARVMAARAECEKDARGDNGLDTRTTYARARILSYCPGEAAKFNELSHLVPRNDKKSMRVKLRSGNNAEARAREAVKMARLIKSSR